MKGLTGILILLWITGPLFSQTAAIPTSREPGFHEFIFVDQEPEPINLPEIQSRIPYPAKAYWNNTGGTMYFRVLVNEHGQYEKHKVTRIIDPVLMEAADPYIKKLKFTPARIGNRNVKYWVNLSFAFNPRGISRNTQELKHPTLFHQTLAHKLLSSNRKGDRYLNKGMVLTEEEKYSEALEVLSRCIRFTPRKQRSYPLLVNAYYHRGRIYGRMGDWKQADEDFTEAIGYLNTKGSISEELQEVGPAIFLHRALASIQMGEEVRALNDYCWVGRMFSENLWSQTDVFAEYTLPETDLRVCSRALGRMSDIDPDDLLLKTQMENLSVYLTSGEQSLGQGGIRVSDRPEVQIFSGKTQDAWTQVKTQNFESALATVSEVIESDPHNAEAYLVKALAMVAIGADNEACLQLDQALVYGLSEDKRQRVLSLMQKICH